MNQDEIGGFNESFERYKDRITNFSNEFEFGLFIHIFKRSLPIALLLVALSATAAFIYLRYTTPIYRAATVIHLEESDKAKMVLKVDNYTDDANLAANIELLKSNYILERCAENLNLPVRYFEQGEVRGSEQFENNPYLIELIGDSSLAHLQGKTIFIDFQSNEDFNLRIGEETFGPFSIAEEFELSNARLVVLRNLDHPVKLEPKENDRYFEFTSQNQLVQELLRSMTISTVNATAKTIEISYKNPNARLAKVLADNHAETFLQYQQAQKEESSMRILEFIDSQLDTVAENLRNAEFLLNSFKQEYKLSDIENISGVFLDRINEVEQRLFELEVERGLLGEVMKIEDAETNGMDVYKTLSIIIGSRFENNIQNQLNALAELIKKKEEDGFELTSESDFIKSIDYRIEIQKNLIVESLRALQTKNRSEEEILLRKRAKLEGTFSGLPNQELEYARYKRLYSINERYYTDLLAKKIEYRISKAGFVTENKILQKAVVPTRPIEPTPSIVYSGFIALGALLSLLFVVVRYLLHNNITSLNEIAKLSQASIGVLGIIPKYKENIPVSQLIINKKPKSLIAEAFRSIRTNMEFLGNQEGSKVIAVTSTISSEGKTFVALNLAGIIALSGKKVVILDLDMRRPKIHKGFSVSNELGMSTLLISKHSMADCIRHSELEGLDFITAGPIPPNPSELIISPRMQEILDEAKALYDIVVIDNPPVGLVTDGVASIKMADFPVYIFRADYSKKHFVQNVDRLINENGISKLSVILNSVDVERNKYGAYYGYGYGYGYGYAYGSGYGSGYGNGYYDEKTSEGSWFKRLKQRLWK